VALVLVLGLLGPGTALAWAGERMDAGDHAYTEPDGFRQAQPDIVAAMRGLATTLLTALEPDTRSAPLGRGMTRGPASEPDQVLLFIAGIAGANDRADDALAAVERETAMDLWAVGLASKSKQLDMDPIERRVGGGGGGVWQIGRVSYARDDNTQRRLRVALGRQGRYGVLVAMDSAANQETAVAAEWEALLASVRIGRRPPPPPLTERYPGLVWGGAGLALAGLLLVGALLLGRRRRSMASRRSGPRRGAYGIDVRALSLSQLREVGAEPLPAAPAAPVSPQPPRARRRGRPTRGAADAEQDALPVDIAERMPREEGAAPAPPRGGDPDLAELAQRIAAAEAAAAGRAATWTPPPAPSYIHQAPIDAAARPPAEAPVQPWPPAPEEEPEVAPAEPMPQVAPRPPAPPRRTLKVPSGTPPVGRIVRNDEYLEE
jgi:hypothetical protein